MSFDVVADAKTRFVRLLNSERGHRDIDAGDAEVLTPIVHQIIDDFLFLMRSAPPELGQNVQRGQTVAIVSSNELADVQSGYLTALAALDEHHRHHARTMKLVKIGAASREELEMANTKLRDAEAAVANLRQKLLLLGLSSQRIASLNSTSQISSEVSVPAPSSGTLTSRSVNSGEVIEANKELMRVTDLSNIWVVGQVYEKDLATVRVGRGANITSDAYPGRVFRGRVSYVDPKVDQATSVRRLRIGLPLKEREMKKTHELTRRQMAAFIETRFSRTIHVHLQLCSSATPLE